MLFIMKLVFVRCCLGCASDTFLRFHLRAGAYNVGNQNGNTNGNYNLGNLNGNGNGRANTGSGNGNVNGNGNAGSNNGNILLATAQP